jgi:hypothetical protein
MKTEKYGISGVKDGATLLQPNCIIAMQHPTRKGTDCLPKKTDIIVRIDWLVEEHRIKCADA